MKKTLSVFIAIIILTTGGILQVCASDLPVIPNTDRGYMVCYDGFSFDNFKDDTHKGHCFGMSMVSAGYFHYNWEQHFIYDNWELKDLIEYSLTDELNSVLCKYQSMQGSASKNAIVAGGSYYLNDKKSDIVSDWNDVIDYAKNGEYCSGSLQIGYRKNRSGHAINFLRYEVVDGQERIYAYDNNFPNEETYFYMSGGKVFQAPKSTFYGAIDSICLRDIFTYFDTVEDFDMGRALYADAEMISIDCAEAYPMECGYYENEYIMYEMPEGTTEITIIPLEDNATFNYLDKEYSFGEVDENTVGKLVLSTGEGDSVTEPEFVVEDSTHEYNYSFYIQEPSRTEIRNKDTIVLHAIIDGNVPEDSYIEWDMSEGNFSLGWDSDTDVYATAEDKGWDTITAILYDADGNELARDSVELYSKSGFFDKIGGFFRSLFGMTKTYYN